MGYLKEAHRLSSHWLSGNPTTCSGSVRVAARGLPLIIPGRLRNAIYARKNLNILRAVLTFLSTFRVMDAELKLKLNTITDPFSGIEKTLPQDELFLAIKRLLGNNRFDVSDKSPEDPSHCNRLLCITKAGPNGRVSMKNSVIDAYALFKNPHVYSHLIKLADTMAPYLSKLLRNEVTTIRAVLDYPQAK